MTEMMGSKIHHWASSPGRARASLFLALAHVRGKLPGRQLLLVVGGPVRVSDIPADTVVTLKVRAHVIEDRLFHGPVHYVQRIDQEEQGGI